jgi:hypothetical protein
LKLIVIGRLHHQDGIVAAAEPNLGNSQAGFANASILHFSSRRALLRASVKSAMLGLQ